MLAAALVILLVAMLAYANGANDNSKGVATLVGFGTATPRQALLWAMLTTAIGAAFSFVAARGLIEAFKTRLFVPGTAIGSTFFIAVLVGAIGWVVLATWSGLPVSTTHAIVGALVGAGLVAFGHRQIMWAFLGKSVAIPLIGGPVLSTLLVYLLAWPVARVARRFASRCVCVSAQMLPAAAGGPPLAAAPLPPALTAATGAASDCEIAAPVVAVTGSKVAEAIHWASSGLVGFARGWNDAPKIAALAIVGLSATRISNPAAVAFMIVTLAMALGGFFSGRRVLETLARKLTPLPLAESLTASMTTAALVSASSWASLPVSTTHVATGAVIGAGLKNDAAAVRWGKVIEIVLSWFVTLPVAGIIAAITVWIVG